MQTITKSLPNLELTFYRECIEYKVREPDPQWTFTDSYGHLHKWDCTTDPPTLPTLMWKKLMTADEDGEPIDVGYYTCLECGKKVTPGYRDSPTQQEYGPWHLKGEIRLDHEWFTINNATQEVLAEDLLQGLGILGRLSIGQILTRRGRDKTTQDVQFFSKGPVAFDLNKLQVTHK